MTRASRSDHHWRMLTPQDNAAVHDALIAGARVVDLAAAYGVSTRTIYREAHRARSPHTVLTAFGLRATFVLGDDGQPVRMSPWVPV